MKPVILVVDDEPINVKIMAAVLEANDYQVRSAFSGEECLRRVAIEPPDVILLDIMMPVMDGYEASRQIRRSGRWPQLPIVALTANAFAEDRRACLEAGMDDHLVKPLDAASLRAALTRWTKRDIRAKVG